MDSVSTNNTLEDLEREMSATSTRSTRSSIVSSTKVHVLDDPLKEEPEPESYPEEVQHNFREEAAQYNKPPDNGKQGYPVCFPILTKAMLSRVNTKTYVTGRFWKPSGARKHGLWRRRRVWIGSFLCFLSTRNLNPLYCFDIPGLNLSLRQGHPGVSHYSINYLIICRNFSPSFDRYERAVIFQLGRVKKGGVMGPGLFFIVPCTDQVIMKSLS